MLLYAVLQKRIADLSIQEKEHINARIVKEVAHSYIRRIILHTFTNPTLQALTLMLIIAQLAIVLWDIGFQVQCNLETESDYWVDIFNFCYVIYFTARLLVVVEII